MNKRERKLQQVHIVFSRSLSYTHGNARHEQKTLDDKKNLDLKENAGIASAENFDFLLS